MGHIGRVSSLLQFVRGEKSKQIYNIDDSGNDEEVIRIEGREIKIKLRLIKEFLSVKQMQLAMFFYLDRFSEKTMNELGIEEYREERKGKDFIYSIGARPFTFGDRRNVQSQGYLVGKKLIAGLRNFKPSRFGSEQRKFLEFIINVDEEGKPVTYTCDAESLSNYFGKNPGAPHYLTPVNFRKEVLSKYYAQPGKYCVGDGYLICGGLWSLRMDNNHSDFVMVFLGDLGLLSYDEQMHWRSFNITAKGKMSHTAWVRGFEGQFANPEKSDLFFKQKLAVFQENWQKIFGWKLFRPLNKGDEHFLTSLRVPLTNDQKEFDEQVLALVKVLIDSLNEDQLSRDITIDKKDPRGLDKLEAFLFSKGVSIPQMIEFLRNLQSLRSSSVAHRKGKNYEKVKKFFGIDEKDFTIVFDEILIEAVYTLNKLDEYFLAEPSNRLESES